MAVSVVVSLLGKQMRTQLVGGGVVEGKLLRADEVGGLFEMHTLTHETPTGPIGVEVSEDATQAYCFIPWSQINLMIPFPGEIQEH